MEYSPAALANAASRDSARSFSRVMDRLSGAASPRPSLLPARCFLDRRQLRLHRFRLAVGRRNEDVPGVHAAAVEHVRIVLEKVLQHFVRCLLQHELVPAQGGRQFDAQLVLGDDQLLEKFLKVLLLLLGFFLDLVEVLIDFLRIDGELELVQVLIDDDVVDEIVENLLAGLFAASAAARACKPR